MCVEHDMKGRAALTSAEEPVAAGITMVAARSGLSDLSAVLFRTPTRMASATSKASRAGSNTVPVRVSMQSGARWRCLSMSWARSKPEILRRDFSSRMCASPTLQAIRRGCCSHRSVHGWTGPLVHPKNHRGKAAEEPAAGRLVRSERRIRRRQRAPHMCDRASVEAEPLFGLLEVAAYDVRELLV